MKTAKEQIKVVLFTAMLAFCNLAQSQDKDRVGGQESGGGSAIWEGEKLTVADLAVFRDTGAVTLPKQYISYLKRAQLLAGGYGRYDLYQFFEDHVFGREVQIIMKENLPCSDDPLPGVPGLQIQYGCTDEAGVTYLKPSIFKRMDFHHQAMAILHERLHVALDDSHKAIALHVAVISFALRAYEEQANGIWKEITPSNRKLIEKFVRSDLNERNLKEWKKDQMVNEYGGLLFGEGILIEDSRIGIGSTIRALNSVVTIKNSTIINSLVMVPWDQFKDELQIPKTIDRSHIQSSSLNVLGVRNSKITHSRITTLYENEFRSKGYFSPGSIDVAWIVDSSISNVRGLRPNNSKFEYRRGFAVVGHIQDGNSTTPKTGCGWAHYKYDVEEAWALEYYYLRDLPLEAKAKCSIF